MKHKQTWWGTGAWAPSDVVEVVTRFARRLNQEVGWPEIEQLLVLINQVCIQACKSCNHYMWNPSSAVSSAIHALQDMTYAEQRSVVLLPRCILLYVHTHVVSLCWA